MPRRRHFLAAALLCALALASDNARAQAVFDTLHKSYAPYMDARDPLAMGLKFRSISSDPYRFWRGAKESFFGWAKDDCQDWLADPDAFVLQHGDQHVGNIGTYARGGVPFGHVAFGLVDFDDSHTLPFQLELMQGIVTMRLIADQKKLSLGPEKLTELTDALCDTYLHASAANSNATQLLADDPLAKDLLDAADAKYHEELKQYTDGNGKFLSVIRKKKGEPKDVLRPAMDKADALAQGLANAIAHSPSLAAKVRYTTAAQFRAATRDVALRTRLDSSGSQGLHKYLVLLEKPLVGVDDDVIFYLKREIPTSAERSGIVPLDKRQPGRRCAEDQAALTSPNPWASSWCDVGTESFWVTLKDPWGEELDWKYVLNTKDLLHLARVWGTVTGASHQRQSAMFTTKLTPRLRRQILARSTTYLNLLEEQFADLKSDARAQSLIHAAEKEIEALTTR